MASNLDGENGATANSTMSMLQSLKSTLEAKNKEIQELQQALKAKEEANLVLSRQNVQLSNEASKLKRELNEINEVMKLISGESANEGSVLGPSETERGEPRGERDARKGEVHPSASSTGQGTQEANERLNIEREAEGRQKCNEISTVSNAVVNESELEMMQEKIAKILQKSKSSYVEKIEDALAKNPDGLEAIELQRQHNEIVNETRKLLKMEVRRVRRDESMEAQLTSLQTYADDYWKVVLEGNTNMCKRRERKEEERKKLEEDMKRKQRPLPPLVFQLQQKSIKMGMLIDGKPQMLKNGSGEASTPLLVGLTKEGDLIYGSKVLANVLPEEDPSQSNLKTYWWVAGQFISYGRDTWTESIQLNNGDRALHKISVEFLLAFILRKFKDQVETEMKGTCSVAIITVPFWFCSSQRIQVKDGGKLAGFSEVYLVNEASAAAVACASSELRSSPAHNILVISENADHIDASIYAYATRAKSVTMVGQCGNYSLEVKPRGLLGAILRPYQFMLFGAQADEDEDVKLKNVRRACKDAMAQTVDPKYNTVEGTSRPIEVFVVCESDKWRPLLERIGREYARKICDIDAENAVIFGAALLSQNPVEINEKIRDKLAWEVLRKCGEGTASCFLSNRDLLPIKHRKLTTSLPTARGESIQFLMGCHCNVGILHIQQRAIRPQHQLNVDLRISNEAILELDNVRLSSRSNSSTDLLLESDYTWTTPNLTPEDMARLRSLVESLFEVKEQVSDITENDNNALPTAKQRLLQLCTELKAILELGTVFKIKSAVVKGLFAQKIEDAINVATHACSTLDQVEGEMVSLTNWSSKYRK